MKYRVIERNGKFEPQVRILFVWCTIKEGYWQQPVRCHTLEEAKRTISLHRSERKNSVSKVVHEE